MSILLRVLPLCTAFAALASVCCAADSDPGRDNIGTPYQTLAEEEKNEGAVRMVFIGSSYTAAAGGQQHLVPAFLRASGWQVEVGSHLGPGMSVVKQIYYNRGEIPPRYQRYLERVKEREGADSESYREKLANHREWAQKAKGKLDEVLEGGEWDIAVFGGRGTDEVFHRCVDEMVEKIRATNPEAAVFLYNTWVDQKKPKEQTASTVAAVKACLRNGIGMAPAGEAMHAAHAAKPELTVFRTDTDSHPGHHGAYVIACTIYGTLTEKSPVGLPHAMVIPTSYDFGNPKEEKQAEFKVDEDAARFLQETAWQACRENLRRMHQTASEEEG